MTNSDLSHTSARELWKGSSDEVIFSHDNQDTNVHAKTHFYNLGLTTSYGLPFQMQVDLRMDYTKSNIKGANHPDEKVGGDGAQVNALSKVSLKLTKVLLTKGSYALDMSLEHVKPIEDTPKNPTSNIVLICFSIMLVVVLHMSPIKKLQVELIGAALGYQ